MEVTRAQFCLELHCEYALTADISWLFLTSLLLYLVLEIAAVLLRFLNLCVSILWLQLSAISAAVSTLSVPEIRQTGYFIFIHIIGYEIDFIDYGCFTNTNLFHYLSLKTI